jgi:hypothetical protein
MARVLAVSMVVWSMATLAQQRTVARVVSVQGATFTIEVLEGGVSDTEALELWTPSGKKSVTMAVPGSGWLDRGVLREGVSCKGGTPVARAVLTKPGQVSSWAAAQAAVAAFPPKTLARVLSVEGSTVTLECVVGTLTNGMTLELLTAEGVAPVTVTLPSGLDLVLTGDKPKGVTVSGGKVSVGALIADRARFASLAEASAAGGPSKPATVPETSAAPAFKPNPAACVFTPAELKAALGFEVGAGTGTERPFSGGSSLSCTYLEPKGSRSVVVNRTVMTTGPAAVNAAASKKLLAGKLEPIPGDADGAGWQVGQGDLTDVTLHYWRDNTGTEVRVGGVDQKNAAAVAAMRKSVLKLRRP